ncbi:MAG: hypothetical protein RLZZ225_1247 [Pseudomonadota bacterium]|jgi:hypothetical protein
MNYSPEEFIKAIQVAPCNLSAGVSQVSSDLVDRNQEDIAINGVLLKDIDIPHIYSVWNHLFGKIVHFDKLISLWTTFANRYFHQGGFLYLLEGMIADRLVAKFVTRQDKPIFFQLKPSKKALYMDFNHENNSLFFKEEICYTQLKDAEEACSFEAKQGSYLFKGELLHKLVLDLTSGSPMFKHIIQKVDFDSCLSKSKYQLYRCEKKQRQSKCNVYLESLHLEFDELDGLAKIYKGISANKAIFRQKNKNEETANNNYRDGYYQDSVVLPYANQRMAMFFPSMDCSNPLREMDTHHQWPIASSETAYAYNDSLVRKPVVRKKKRATKADKQLIVAQGYPDLAHPHVDNSALLLPLEPLPITYAIPELNVAMDGLSLSSAHQASGFFSAENRHKKLSRATANQCTEVDLIDPIPGATGTTWDSFP